MITDTKAAERLAAQLAMTLACPLGGRKTRGRNIGGDLDLCLDARATACWLAWARRDDEAAEKAETGGVKP